MNILISNDDGIDAEGLIAVAKAFKSLGKVTVIAPNSQRSCTSHGMTISGKVQVEKVDFNDDEIDAWVCYGTAVDCVRFAVRCLMKERPDLIVTGINHDPNMGSDIIYSATVACAREGYLQGIPSLATAICSSQYHNFEPTCKYALEIAQKLLKDPHNKEYFLSLNVPAIDHPKGLVVCDSYGFRDYNETYRLEHIDGKDYVTINDTIISDCFDLEDMTIDFNAARAGYATLTAYRVSQIHDGVTDILKDTYL